MASSGGIVLAITFEDIRPRHRETTHMHVNGNETMDVDAFASGLLSRRDNTLVITSTLDSARSPSCVGLVALDGMTGRKEGYCSEGYPRQARGGKSHPQASP